MFDVFQIYSYAFEHMKAYRCCLAIIKAERSMSHFANYRESYQTPRETLDEQTRKVSDALTYSFRLYCIRVFY
jgi:hypothetical protein